MVRRILNDDHIPVLSVGFQEDAGCHIKIFEERISMLFLLMSNYIPNPDLMIGKSQENNSYEIMPT